MKDAHRARHDIAVPGLAVPGLEATSAGRPKGNDSWETNR
jgi:hypothetical protein